MAKPSLVHARNALRTRLGSFEFPGVKPKERPRASLVTAWHGVNLAEQGGNPASTDSEECLSLNRVFQQKNLPSAGVGAC